MNAVTRKILVASGLFFAVSLHTDQGYAQSAGSRTAPAMQRLLDCRSLAETSTRLACYDAAAESLRLAEQTGEIVVVERQRVLETNRALFGFTLPDVSSLLGGERSQLDEVETTLERASYVAGAGWTFYLADGSTWRQIDTTSLQFRAIAGLPVKIRRAAMGSYMLKVANNPAVRAKRQ